MTKNLSEAHTGENLEVHRKGQNQRKSIKKLNLKREPQKTWRGWVIQTPTGYQESLKTRAVFKIEKSEIF